MEDELEKRYREMAADHKAEVEALERWVMSAMSLGASSRVLTAFPKDA